MNFIDIMEHKDCPEELLDTYQKNYVEVRPHKSVVIFRDEKIGGGSAIVVTGEGDDLKFGTPHNFTYHDVGNLRIEAENDIVKITCRSTDLDRDIEFNLFLKDSELIPLGEKEII